MKRQQWILHTEMEELEEDDPQSHAVNWWKVTLEEWEQKDTILRPCDFEDKIRLFSECIEGLDITSIKADLNRLEALLLE